MLEDEGFEDVEPAEDTVPYIPPLASYPVKVVWGEVRWGVPNIYPDEIFEYDEDD